MRPAGMAVALDIRRELVAQGKTIYMSVQRLEGGCVSAMR